MKELVYMFEEIDYALIHWASNTCTPWVAAWGYDPEKGNWCQGHYFKTKESAMCYIGEKYQMKFEPPVRKTPKEEIEELRTLINKYGYEYDFFGYHSGLVLASCSEDAYAKLDDFFSEEYMDMYGRKTDIKTLEQNNKVWVAHYPNAFYDKDVFDTEA